MTITIPQVLEELMRMRLEVARLEGENTGLRNTIAFLEEHHALS